MQIGSEYQGSIKWNVSARDLCDPYYTKMTDENLARYARLRPLPAPDEAS